MSNNNISISTALDPTLSFQLLCDFNLQRIVEYYIYLNNRCESDDKDNHNTSNKICFSFPSNIILLPCRHACCCLNCYKHIEQCPMCENQLDKH